MSKQARVPTDPQTLKPIIEAMIFASEEPLSARALIRFLVGDRDNEKAEEEAPPLAAMMDEAAPADDAVSDAPIETEPVAEASVDESPVDEASVESAAEQVEGNEPDEAEAAPAADASADDAPTDERDGEPTDLSNAMERVESRTSRGRDGAQQLDQAYIREMIAELNDEYQESGRVFRIIEVAGGFQFATVREYGEFVAMLSKEKLRRRLSPAALETLAIIAYRQPVSKPEVEAIRGVNCDQVLVNLMEKNLIAITGRSEGVGRPLLYGTTEDFLRSFGLKGIGDLPKLREIEELMEDDAYSPEKIEVVTVDANTDVEEIEARVGAAGHTDNDTEAQDGLPVAAEAAPAGEQGVEGNADASEDAGEMIAEAEMTGDEEASDDESLDEEPAGEALDEESEDEEMEEESSDEEIDDENEEMDDEEIEDDDLDDEDDLDDDEDSGDEESIDEEDLDEEEITDDEDLDDEEIADDEELDDEVSDDGEDLDDDVSDEEEEDEPFAKLEDRDGDAPVDEGHDEHANGASDEIPHDMRAA